MKILMQHRKTAWERAEKHCKSMDDGPAKDKAMTDFAEKEMVRLAELHEARPKKRIGPRKYAGMVLLGARQSCSGFQNPDFMNNDRY